jgi:hypothetical protein
LTEQVNVEEFSDAAATFLDDDGYPLKLSNSRKACGRRLYR